MIRLTQANGTLSECDLPRCDVALPIGTVVTLTAIADPGNQISTWTPACPGGPSDTCTLTVAPGSTTVTTTFVPAVGVGGLAIELEIRDGSDPTWWDSPDIWVVPATDPVEGQPAYVWARVRNNGSATAVDANVVYLAFADLEGPVDFRRADFREATGVGSATVTLEPNQPVAVMCPVPWVPDFNGHARLVVLVGHPDDPLPPGPVADVPGDRHVAELDVAVLPTVQ